MSETEVEVNGVTLFCATTGQGDPLVLVHGGWTEHRSWQLVVPELSKSFHVMAYDRRGHSRSQRVDGPRSTHEDDLAALIEELGLAPAHLAGTSYGASIALGVAARRPELVRSIVAHEPPLLDVVDGNPSLADEIRTVRAALAAVADDVRAGRVEPGVARFVEEITLGPGMWEKLPVDLRRTMIGNSPTFLATMDDPRWADLDVRAVDRLPVPILLTDGDRSPAWLPALVSELARQLSHASRRTYGGAGHVPQITHPDDYAELVGSFARTSGAVP